MIGWLNLGIEHWVVKNYGEEKWHQIVSQCGVNYGWVSSIAYPDEITYKLLDSIATVLGMTFDETLEAYGNFFVNYVTEKGYTKLLKALGSNAVDFLVNLNDLHLHLTMGMQAMVAPGFRTDKVTSHSCELHYHSSRPGLGPLVKGILKGLALSYWKHEISVELIAGRADGSCDHEVFLVSFPHQESPTIDGSAQAKAHHTSITGFTLPPDTFSALHPFHMLLDKECRLLQHGAVLPRLVPGLAVGATLTDLFVLRHPHMAMSWENVLREKRSSFLLASKSGGLELKGQMVPTHMPQQPGDKGPPREVLLFLGSPRCANLEEFQRHGLFLPDIPLHDMSRDFVLLAEQRQAEADLKEKFEKLTLELQAEKARSDALVQRMSGLIACFPFKGAATSSTTSTASRSMASTAATAVTAGTAGGTFFADDGSVAAGAGGGMGAAPAAGANNRSLFMLQDDESLNRMEVIEAVRRALGHMNLKQSEGEAVEMVEPIGEGTFGKVYRGLWHGTDVAVKTIILPANMSGSEKREKMAIMEAAISSSLSHPNVIQTYTYTIKPLRDSASSDNLVSSSRNSAGRASAMRSLRGSNSGVNSGVNSGAIHSYEVRLILELCDRGSLRDALEQGAFMLDDGRVNLSAVVDTAMDVAKAMIHMHRHGVVHSDLKARNVLLKAVGGVGRGVVAKVGDFGLAVKLDATDTHMSGMFQGTITHMAPEVLISGRVSKAADVYAYGILLWELYTGGHAFKGVPRALLGHQVTMEQRRPDFPRTVPQRYRQLAEWCWNKDDNVRPTFEEILAVLLQLRRADTRPTPPLGLCTPVYASTEVPAAAERPLARASAGARLTGGAAAAEAAAETAAAAAYAPQLGRISAEPSVSTSTHGTVMMCQAQKLHTLLLPPGAVPAAAQLYRQASHSQSMSMQQTLRTASLSQQNLAAMALPGGGEGREPSRDASMSYMPSSSEDDMGCSDDVAGPAAGGWFHKLAAAYDPAVLP